MGQLYDDTHGLGYIGDMQNPGKPALQNPPRQ